MADIRPILDYPTPQSLEKLTLEEGSDFARVVFPVASVWSYRTWIGASVVIAVLTTTQPIWGALIVLRATVAANIHVVIARGTLWYDLVKSSHGDWTWAAIWWCTAIFSWWKYHRWGRVPRVLLARTEGLTLSYLGWFWMRRKHWRASEITAIELRPVRGNLTWWKPAADLRILRRKGIPLRFRLSSSDPQLPDRIAARVRALLARIFHLRADGNLKGRFGVELG